MKNLNSNLERSVNSFEEASRLLSKLKEMMDEINQLDDNPYVIYKFLISEKIHDKGIAVFNGNNFIKFKIASSCDDGRKVSVSVILKDE